MRILKIIFFTLILSFSFQDWEAFSPNKESSWTSLCEYKIKWNTSIWTVYNWAWTSFTCSTWNININSIVSDGVYDLELRSKDNNTLWDNKTYSDSIWASKHNKFWIYTFWPYKKDSTPPKCILKSITFYWLNNQYYNAWKLYYKSGTSAAWRFDLEVECKDTSNPWATCIGWSCVWGIKKIKFPSILWINPVVSNYNPTEEVINITQSYNWSWNYTDSFDVLNMTTHYIAEDISWNETVLEKDSSTKVIFKKTDWTLLQEITWITSLTLTPDSESPKIDNNSISSELLWNNWFLYKNTSWNLVNIYNLDTSETKYFAADDNKFLQTPTFTDNWAWIQSFEVLLEKYDDPSGKQTYSFTWTSFINRQTSLSGSLNHNFSRVSFKDYSAWFRNYSWDLNTRKVDWNKINWQICDMVGNCANIPNPDLKVVAWETNYDNSEKTSLSASYIGKESNYSDEYTTSVTLLDKYWNYISGVLWVKDLELNIKFDNTLWKDQINYPDTWDAVGFEFQDWYNSILNLWTWYKNFTITVDRESDFRNWQINIKVKSAVPTKWEYLSSLTNAFQPWQSLYWTSTAKLILDSLEVKTLKKTSYSWVWEKNSLEFASVQKPDYRFNPYININKITNIYPLVEWQEKKLNIYWERIPSIPDFELKWYLWSNNLFINFENLKLNWTLLPWYSSISWEFSMNKNHFLPTNPDFSFTPKTIWWIEWSNNKIAVFTELTYDVNWLNWVKLPSIQSGFWGFWPKNISDFSGGGTWNNWYSASSNITLAEIDVKWITQTKNKLWTTVWTWSTTTDNNTFKDFSKIALQDLKTNIRQNVEFILKWLNKESWRILSTTTLSQNDLNNFTNEVTWLKTSSNNVIYFKWWNVKIDCSNICNISWNKTIIIEDGNLLLDSNLRYNDSNSILWIILLQKDSWKAMLKINENITNWVWVVYAEWPIVSYNGNENHIYDLSNIWTDKLSNQLFWKWSFASKNTVGWAINFDSKKSCPYWTSEYEQTSCTKEKAQWYDLIYLRRYAVVPADAEWVTCSPVDKLIPLHSNSKDVFVAGWNKFDSSCNEIWINDYWKPTTPNLKAPLIIEYDSRLKSTPPVLFSNQ